MQEMEVLSNRSPPGIARPKVALSIFPRPPRRKVARARAGERLTPRAVPVRYTHPIVAKNTKTAPARRPVKARGTIPVPKVGHRPVRLPWYRNRQLQVIGGLIVLVVLGVAASQVVAWRHRVHEREADRKAVKAFNDRITAIQGQIIEPLNGIQAVPEQFRNGQIKADAYKDAAGKWLATFQRMASDLRSLRPPAELGPTRAHFEEAAVLFVDATRTYQLAAQTSEAPVRDEAILLAAREMNHAETMYTNALKELDAVKKRVGLPAGTQPSEPELPQEDVTPPTGQSSAPAPSAPAPGPTSP
jgi:hypothetical protein